MNDAVLSSEELATPKTDAAAVYADTHAGRTVRVVPYDFARDQERRIAELEEQLRKSKMREGPLELDGFRRYRD